MRSTGSTQKGHMRSLIHCSSSILFYPAKKDMEQVMLVANAFDLEGSPDEIAHLKGRRQA